MNQLHTYIAEKYNNPIVEQRICPYTGKAFFIHQSYIDLLKKVSPTIAGEKYEFPLPVMSHPVRERIRTMFRNEKIFYSSTSSKSGSRIVSLYAPNTVKVYTTKERRDDTNDPMQLGISDTSNYMRAIKTLNDTVPRLNVMTASNENSEYTSGTGYCKDCYLICASEYAENCYYSKLLQTVEYTVDSLNIFKSARLYQCINCKNCNKSIYLKNSSNCHNSWFSDQLTGCSNCLLCTGLVNKQYHYKNQVISKEAFEEKMKQLKGSYVVFEAYKIAYKEMLKTNIVKYSDVINVEKVVGNNLFDSKNCYFCFNGNELENCEYLTVGEKCKNNIDCNNMYVNIEKSYNVLGTINTYDVHNSLYVFDSKQLLYCQDCYDCNYCFGCFGLRGKEYCIFNTQYTKDEYEQKVKILIKQMQNDGIRGDFFMTAFAQFPYNDTVAMEYYPVEKVIDLHGKETMINPEGEGVVYLKGSGDIVDAELDLGGIKRLPIKRKTIEREINIPAEAEIIQAESLPDNITDVNDDIIKKVIICKRSGRPFRVIKQELEFYRKMGIPLPREHQDIRYQDRLAMLQKHELYIRKCDKTGNSMISVYSSQDKRKVYSAEAYDQEIFG